MDTEQNYQFCEEIIFCEQAFGLVCIKGLEILGHYKLLLSALLDVVSLEHSVLQQVRIGNVVQDCVAQYLQLFKVPVQIVALLKSTVGECVEKQVFVRKFVVQNLLHRSNHRAFQL